MKRLALLLVLSLSVLALGAQEDWFWGKPISAIQWEGVDHADRRELDSVTKPYLGRAFTEDLWMELQARVYGLDLFESIEPAAFPADEAQSKVLIKFVVKEKSAVGQVRIAGNSELRTTELLDVVSLKVGDIYNAQTTRLDELALKRHYLEKGYPDAVVSSSIADSGRPGEIVVSFTIREGARVSVREIRFTGNSALSTKTLKGQMSLKEAGLFQDGAFQESKLEEDKATIVDLYRSRGYIDAKVSDVIREQQRDEKDGRSWLVLTVAISEGRQWLYDGMTFEGNTIFATEKLASLVTQKPGAVLNFRRLMLDKQRIDDLYYESGYIFNSLELAEKRDEGRGSVAFVVRISERDRAHIESITFKGNSKTKEEVLSRELPLEVGDIFSKAKVVEGLRNLYNLQYFSAVEPEMLPGSAENLMDLVINVEEQSTADIQFGVTLSGFGDPDSFPVSGLIKWNDRNFLGKGQTFGVELNAAPDDQTLTFSFLDKWLLGQRLSGGVDLSFSHKKNLTGQDLLAPLFEDGVPDPYASYEEYEDAGFVIPDAYRMPYDSWEFSLGFSTGYSWPTFLGDLGVGLGLSTSLSSVSYDESKYRPALEEIRSANDKWSFGNKLILRSYLNRLDLWYNPGKGYYASQRFSLAGFFDWEYQHYLKSETRLEAYHTLFSLPVFEGWNFKWVVGAHTSFSAIFRKPGYDSPIVSTDDALRIDGTFVGRGWNSLYSTTGLTLWESWLELRMPIFEQILWLDGFFDAAALRTKDGLLVMTGADPVVDSNATGFSSLSWENMAFSLGFGLRFTIPQFPFRFYFAKRFSFDGSELDWKRASGFDFVISISQPLN